MVRCIYAIKDSDATFETAFYVEEIRSVREKHGSYKVNLRCYIRKGRSRKDHIWMPTFKHWRARVASYATHKIRIVVWRDFRVLDHEEYDIELQLGVKPYHARAYPIPKNEQTLRTEVERLCSLGILRKVDHSEWVAPTFRVNSNVVS